MSGNISVIGLYFQTRNSKKLSIEQLRVTAFHRSAQVSKKIVSRHLGALLLIGLFVVPQLVVAWSESSTSPLTGTPPTFLNGSSAAQRKDGSLLLGASTRSSKLCLNANPDLSIQSAANTLCIDSWLDVATAAGPFVRRQENTTPSNQADPSTYGTADAGFAAVAGLASRNQFLSTVVKANTASTAGTKYAVYATDAGSNGRSAAQLSGKTVIRNAANSAQLCLNGQCITRWSDVGLYAATAVIRLQTGTYLEPDAGTASLSGVLWLQRGLTAGRPLSTTSTTWSGTDGHCTAENGETTVTSPVDCN